MNFQSTKSFVDDLFFNCLKDDELQRICNSLREQEYDKGEHIVYQGDIVKHFSCIKEGLVKLYIVNEIGNDQIITILKPYNFIAILNVFFLHKCSYTFTALTPCVICHIDIDLIRSIIDENTDFSTELMKKFSKISNTTLVELMKFKRLQLRGRLAYVLLSFSQRIYHSLEFDLPVTRKEIAEFVGVSTENIIRTMSEFKKDKIIDFSTKRVKILDVKTLEQISFFG